MNNTINNHHQLAMSKSHTYKSAYDVAAYTVIDRSLVDLEPWITIACTHQVRTWIQDQDPSLYYQHLDPVYARVYGSKFDVSERLLVMLALKFL